MAAKLHFVYDSDGSKYYVFHCPGCECGHMIPVSGPHKWDWNGSVDKPMFKPSILVNRGSVNPVVPTCHSFVTDGSIQFLGDCTHKLAGKTVSIPDWDDEGDDMTDKKEVKNAVMEAKCKLTKDECKDKSCPVHGEPEPEKEKVTSTVAGSGKIAPEVREALADAQQLVKHLNHPNDFSRGLVDRIESILNPLAQQ
jgi:hypothetical protein